MRRILASLGTILCTIALASCGNGDDGPDLTTIQVTPDPLTLAQQQTSQLQVSVLDAQGQLVTGVSVTFSSTDDQVATVSPTGLVTASHTGTASIRVKASDLSHVVPVTVTAVSNAIIVSPNPGVVPQNATLQLNVVVNDLNGLPITGAPLTFTSGTPSLATVSPTGLVHPVGPGGQVIITVGSGALSTTVPVAISQVPTALVVAPSPVHMGKNSSVALIPTVKDMVGATISGVAITYQSSNTALATVSAAGVVQAKGTVGDLEIQAAGAGLSATVPVTVLETASPEGVLDGTSPVEGFAYGIDVSPSGVIMVSGTVTSRATLASRSFTTLVSNTSQYQYAPAIAQTGTSVWISGLPDNSISEVDASTGSILGGVTGAPSINYYMMRFNPVGSKLYASGPGAFLVIDRATRTVDRSVPISSSGISLSLNPVGSSVFVGGSGPIQEISPSTGTTRTVTEEFNTNFAISADGRFLYLVDESTAIIKVVRVSDGVLVRNITMPCAGWGIAMTRDGQKLLVTCGPSVVIVDVLSETVLHSLDVGGNTRRIAFSADGMTAAVSNETLGVNFIK